jgi:hypothetical protein
VIDTMNIAIPQTSTMNGAEKPALIAISGATASAPSNGPIASTDKASDSQKPIERWRRPDLAAELATSHHPYR